MTSNPVGAASEPLNRTAIPHYGTTGPQSGDPWTAAYDEAFGQLDDDMRALVQRGRNLEELFENLSQTNDEHKHNSILRRGLERIQMPLRFFEQALDLGDPAASFHPGASAAFGLIRSVTTLAVGVCGVEERLQQQITSMLEQIDVIDEYDTLGQKLEAGLPLHMTLVLVYRDLLQFYLAVIRLLTRKSAALAFLSEQFNQRIPPIVEDFLRHSNQLHIHITNATAEIVKSVEQLLLDNEIQQLLGAHTLHQLNEFHIALGKKTAEDACQWVMDDPAFRKWYSWRAAQPLILFGDMGCGKTVMMSFLVNRVSKLNRSRIPSPLICYHYCRDDETGQALYIYASLIHQLMHDRPQIKVQFKNWCEDRQREGHKAPAQDSTLLGGFFYDSVRGLKRPVFVFIDGLDECKDQSRIEISKNLMENSRSIPGLRVCVSSRFQEEILRLLTGSFELYMQPPPERDEIIASHMVKKRLRFLNGKGRDFVIQRLTELANGSAIWVQIAVDLLATRKISAPAKLRAFLRDELPQSKLSDLYAELFAQVTGGDEENARVLADALEILAVAERPLSVLELGWAVALKDPDTDATTVEELEEYVDSRRVLGLVSPFIASVDLNDEKRHQVRVVHQSVRELVIQSPPSQWSDLRASPPISSEAVQQRRSEIHGRFVQDCVRYLLLDDLEDKTLFSENETWGQTVEGVFAGMDLSDDDVDSPTDTAEITFFDPSDRGFGDFFVYGSCYWLHHLRRAGHGVALPDFIVLTTENTRRLQNWWEQSLRPDCILQPRELTWHPEPLSIAAVYGTEALVKDLLDAMDAQGDRTRHQAREESCARAVSAVLAQKDLARLPLLIRYREGQDIGPAVNSFFLVIRDWASLRTFGLMTPDKSADFEKIFDHMEGAFDIMVEQEWGNELLCSAAASGCLPVIRRLFAAAEHSPALRRELLRVPDRYGGGLMARQQSVGEAVWNGHADVVRFLLDQDGIEPHLKYKDTRGNNVFHSAARLRQDATLEALELLIARFPEGVNQKNDSGDTPLHLLVFNRGMESASLLLSRGRADVRGGSTEEPSGWYDPIRTAVRGGNVAMCEVLVRVGGADPLSVFKEDEGGGLQFIDPVDESVAEQVRTALFALREEQHGK